LQSSCAGVTLLLLPAGALAAVADDETAADSKQDAAAPADAGSEQQPAAAGAAAVTTSTINFVDLAGSERGSQVAESGEKEKLRQKEVRRQAAALSACRVIRLHAVCCGGSVGCMQHQMPRRRRTQQQLTPAHIPRF
jgi:hypothetical protein